MFHENFGDFKIDEILMLLSKLNSETWNVIKKRDENENETKTLLGENKFFKLTTLSLQFKFSTGIIQVIWEKRRWLKSFHISLKSTCSIVKFIKNRKISREKLQQVEGFKLATISYNFIAFSTQLSREM